MKEKLKKINKIINILFISIISVTICVAIGLAIYFSVKDGDGEEDARAELNSSQWYEIKYEAFTPNTFPSNITSETSITQKVYNTYTEVKFSEENYFTTNWINFRNTVVGDNISFNLWFYNDLSTQNGLRSTKYLKLVINKNRNTGVLSAHAEFKQRTSYNASWSNATINSPQIKLGTDWTSTQDINEENINWCINEFIIQNTYTINSGYYLFPDIATIDTYAQDMALSNAKLLIYSDDTIDETGTYNKVAYTEYNLLSFHLSSNNNLWANSDELSLNITNNNEFKQFFPILYITQDIQVSPTDYEFLSKFIAVDNELVGEYLVPVIKDGVISAYQRGYNAGYDAGIGQSIINDNTEGVISALFHGLFGEIFKIEIFPNFPLYIFLLIPVVFAVLSLILWLMRGK